MIWTEAERARGQAWGVKTVESFHYYGTPPTAEDRGYAVAAGVAAPQPRGGSFGQRRQQRPRSPRRGCASGVLDVALAVHLALGSALRPCRAPFRR